MTERNIHALRAEALARLAEAMQAANDAPDVESAPPSGRAQGW